MTSTQLLTSPLAFTLRKWPSLAACALLMGVSTVTSAAGGLSLARVEKWIATTPAGQGLPEQVACLSDLGAGPGPWLLVSRSWGGSPHLRRYQLVRWDGDAPVTGSHVNVRWGQCLEQGPKSL